MSGFRVDRARMRTHAKMGEIIGYLEGDLLKTRALLARFAVDDNGEYVDQETGIKMVDDLTPDEMYAEAQKLIRRMEDAAAPLSSGKD